MTDRTISFRGKVINIHSGNSHVLLKDSANNMQGLKVQCQPITQSNKMICTFVTGSHLQLAVIDEPGSRKFGCIGKLGWSLVNSIASISENCFLIQIEDYWVIMQNGLLVKIPEGIQKILDEKPLKEISARNALGNISKVVLFYQPDSAEQEAQGEEKAYKNHCAHILLLSDKRKQIFFQNIL